MALRMPCQTVKRLKGPNDLKPPEKRLKKAPHLLNWLADQQIRAQIAIQNIATKNSSLAAALFLPTTLIHSPAFDANWVRGKGGPGALLSHTDLKAQQYAIFTGGARAFDSSNGRWPNRL